ncbi:MAG: FAD-binding protein [Sporomusaceae bacterium]|nr:FAD-binding protein [Sporomusaceae bacterium]
MKLDKVMLRGQEVNLWTLQTIVVGSGAAGWNAADTLFEQGQEDVAVVTEGINMGTSRNTGSDKQTYYKLTLAGEERDSICEMANTLFAGGSRHGDIALVEAALSPRCFYKLVEAGVEFPHSRYGEYFGYKTDHDPKQRATSLGPLTSHVMTERLERRVRQKGIPIFDHCLVIGVLTAEKKRAVGLLALDMTKLHLPGKGITLFNCTNIVYATGGPAGMYEASVYPASQTGALGIAFEAGVSGVNLTESQYGIASTAFRWNLSGSFQQVIPRYLSTDQDGCHPVEFLDAYFPDAGAMLTAIFLKGYQWPFDPRKVAGYGSSLIDLLVYNEINNKGRRVFLDYRQNPSRAMRDGQFAFSLLREEAREYLQRSELLFGTPIERLQKMNMPAVELYRAHGIDLAQEQLEIAVCAQHCNGGLEGDLWWESNIAHFFPVGEACGSSGVYRPGGSALNATQVGGLRAAQYISRHYRQQPPQPDSFLATVSAEVGFKLNLADRLLNANGGVSLQERIAALRRRMSRAGALVREPQQIDRALADCRRELTAFPDGIRLDSAQELPDAFRYYDMLITQCVFLAAIREYIAQGGQSRGSYIISDQAGALPADGLGEQFRYRLDEGDLLQSVGSAGIDREQDWNCWFAWTPVRPVPQQEHWFETLWEEYRTGTIWSKDKS